MTTAKRISVIVFKPSDRPFFHAQWSDPVTGKKKTRSLGTNIRRDAEREAGALEKELRNGTFKDTCRVTWQQFRERVEAEYVPAKADATDGKVQATLNAIERHIDPRLLTGLDAGQISRFQAALRDEDKLAEATIKGHLAYLHAMLEWAKTIGLVESVPEMAMPTRTATRKGRAPTGEEFERMLAAVPGVVNPKAREGKEKTVAQLVADAERTESWNWLLRGLWLSGLRLSEALLLDWNDDTHLCVDFSGRRPMFRIRAEAEKGHKERLLPMAPEFAEMLQAVPEAARVGLVFNPIMQRQHGKGRRLDTVSSIIVDIGKAAGVKVSTSAAGKVKYASAHDLRRAFGTRWAKRVMPAVLQLLMRHDDIATTMTFYVEMEAEATANAVWDAFARGSQSESGVPEKGQSRVQA